MSRDIDGFQGELPTPIRRPSLPKPSSSDHTGVMQVETPAIAGPRVARWVMALAVLGLGCAAAGLWTDLVSGTSTGTALLDSAYVALMVAAGTVVALARPENRIGWLLLVSGAAAGGGGALVTLGTLGITGHHSIPGAGWFAVSGSVIRSYGWFGVTVGLPMWFPTGHTLGGRWRWLNRIFVAILILGTIGQGLASQAQLLNMGTWTNPLSSSVTNAIANPASLLMMLLSAVAIIGSVAQLVVRFRRSDGEVRRQIWLFAIAAALPILAAPLGVAGIADGWIFQVTALPLPLAVGYAIVGGGLYDVSTTANRTLVWITISGTVFAIFAVIVGGAGDLVHGQEWLRWLAAAVVAAAILPLRDHLQRLVNRVTYGRWEDPQVILGALGQRLAGSADVPRLLEDLTTELSDALGLVDVGIVDPSGRVVAGGPRFGEESIPLVAYGRRVGSLRFTMPLDLRPGHHALLSDLATHLGAVMYAGGVTTDLRQARERLVLAREEERRRLRRDLHDGLGPALAGHLLQIEVIAAGIDETHPVRAQLDELSTDIRDTVGDVRRVVEGLRPPALDEIGLVPSLRQSTRRILGAAGVQAAVSSDGVGSLSAAVEVAAYRIVTEAVNNCAKHARATHCDITLTSNGGTLEIAIIDDGNGFNDATHGGHGLQTMRERAEELGGALTVDGKQGTTVRATIPLTASAPIRTADQPDEVAVT